MDIARTYPNEASALAAVEEDREAEYHIIKPQETDSPPDQQTTDSITDSITTPSNPSRSTTASSSEMEAFTLYKAKIEQLLSTIPLVAGFTVLEIQHGYRYQNSVYALVPSSESGTQQQYILRVPTCPVFEHDDGVCETIVNDVAVLEYVSTQLKVPVPRVRAYSATTDNALEAPFVIQTQIEGKCLQHVYGEISLEEKLRIVDQFVDLLVDLDSIRFASAGSFAASSPLSLESSDFVAAVPGAPSALTTVHFGKGDDEFAKSAGAIHDRRGPDLKAFLDSHIIGWILKDLRLNKYDQVTVPPFRRMLAMLKSLDREGAFADAPYPIVLHHTDLEPRNIMVSNRGPSGKWEISGIIDWDEAVAIPRPLARFPPTWIWDFDPDKYSSFPNLDDYSIIEEERLIGEESKALKLYFDAAARKKLGEKYVEDAYGYGSWFRRIWYFVKGGVHSEMCLKLIKIMDDDWEARARTKQLPSTSFAARAIRWSLDLEKQMRKRL